MITVANRRICARKNGMIVSQELRIFKKNNAHGIEVHHEVVLRPRDP